MQAIIFLFSEAGQLYSVNSPMEHIAAEQYSLVPLLGIHSIFQFVKKIKIFSVFSSNNP